MYYTKIFPEFPARPLLYESLADVVGKGWALDAAILSVLQQTTADEHRMEELNAQVYCCSIVRCIVFI